MRKKYYSHNGETTETLRVYDEDDNEYLVTYSYHPGFKATYLDPPESPILNIIEIQDSHYNKIDFSIYDEVIEKLGGEEVLKDEFYENFKFESLIEETYD